MPVEHMNGLTEVAMPAHLLRLSRADRADKQTSWN